MILCNAFSMNMLPDLGDGVYYNVAIQPVDIAAARALLAGNVDSAIGHADTAAVLSGVLGVEVPMVRKNVTIADGDSILVAQYSGPRLPEGTTELPEGASFKWLVVEVQVAA